MGAMALHMQNGIADDGRAVAAGLVFAARCARQQIAEAGGPGNGIDFKQHPGRNYPCSSWRERDAAWRREDRAVQHNVEKKEVHPVLQHVRTGLLAPDFVE